MSDIQTPTTNAPITVPVNASESQTEPTPFAYRHDYVPTLMAVFAHPDDEAFSVGGTLAHYAQKGVKVVLVCATRGEAGKITDPSMTVTDLGQVIKANMAGAKFTDCRIDGMVINGVAQPKLWLSH